MRIKSIIVVLTRRWWPSYRVTILGGLVVGAFYFALDRSLPIDDAYDGREHQLTDSQTSLLLGAYVEPFQPSLTACEDFI